MSKITFETRIKILILIVFLIPSKQIEIYIITLSLMQLILFPKMKISKNLLIIFSIFSTYIATITLIDSANFRNLTELMRFLPLLLLTRFYGKLDADASHTVLYSIFYLAILVGVISCVQIISPNNPISNAIAETYNTTGHYTKSFIGNNRASAVGTGPGQAGALGALVFSAACASLLHAKRSKRKLSIVAMFSSVIIVLAAQSQTALITIIVISTISYLLNFSKITMAFHICVLMLALSGANLLNRISNIYNIDYLMTLFVHGLARSSFVKRVDKWSEMIGAVQDRPFLWIMGVGKDFHGVKSAATDSDWVYLLTVYGIIPTILVFSAVIYVFIQRIKTSNFSVELKFLTVSCGVIISLASAFLFDVKIVMIFILITVCAKNIGVKNA
jgi:hypothetical protein